jgi:uncharacterized protein (TIGR02646 family)
MRFIRKGPDPAVLADWIAIQLPVGLNLDYDAFPYKTDLKDGLIAEQFGLCGYTGERIDSVSSHIEHLKPQKVCNAEIESRGGQIGHEIGEDLSYHNMIAARTVAGKKPYGAAAKADWYDPLLFVSPLEDDCAAHFTFALDGSISGTDAAGRATVERLRLDHPLLTDSRRGTLDAFLPVDLIERTYLEDLITKTEPANDFVGFLPEFAFVIRSVAENLLRTAAA